MISSGLSLMRALMVLESQTESPRLKATVVTIRQDIEAGASLSAALARHPKIFSQLYVAMIRAGETGGFLEARCCASPTSWRRRTSSGARCAPRWCTPRS